MTRTRWPHTWELLTGKPLLTPSQRQAQEAEARLRDAEARGDDRDIGKAQTDLRQAQHDRLREGS